MLTPSIGFCPMPLTVIGSGSPAASRMVGATSITWWNCQRHSPFVLIPFGHWTIVPLRVPPQCDPDIDPDALVGGSSCETAGVSENAAAAAHTSPVGAIPRLDCNAM